MFSRRGLRTLGVAMKTMPGRSTIQRADESPLTFIGFLAFADPPKAGVAAAIQELRSLGVALKVITGDNRLVAQEVALQIAWTIRI
jgi:Mg2+-importing ATPase